MEVFHLLPIHFQLLPLGLQNFTRLPFDSQNFHLTSILTSKTSMLTPKTSIYFDFQKFHFGNIMEVLEIKWKSN